ncbi:CAP domain-containing protein [Patescibacteria group bacterium]
MKKTFKKYFVPHEHNDHKPHFLRKRAVISLLVLIIIFEAVFLSQIFIVFKDTGLLAAILPGVLIDLTNGERESVNEPLLVRNEVLDAAATAKAEDMANKEYFAHVSPEGFTPWYWFDQKGYNFVYAGENLAVNFYDSKDVVEAWMNSPKHKDNVLNEKFREIGIGVAQGIYKEQDAIFIVQLFGTPRKVIAYETPVVQESVAEPVLVVVNTEINPPANEQEMFVEVAATAEPVVASNTETLGYSSLTERLISMPRAVNESILLFFAGLLGLALVLKIFIKMHIQHPYLIANGCFVILVLGVLLYANQELSLISSAIF